MQLAHAQGEIGLRCFNQQMIVIAHQTIGMTNPPKRLDHLDQRAQKTRGQCRPCDLYIATGGDMLERMWEFEAEGRAMRIGWGFKYMMSRLRILTLPTKYIAIVMLSWLNRKTSVRL